VVIDEFMSVTLYGLENCDTCRKARQWLATQAIDHAFVDIRQDGIEPDRLDRWLDDAGWQTLLNRRSRTWRELPESQRSELDRARARELMLQYPMLIKRPVLEHTTGVVVGFSPVAYETALAGAG